MTTVRLVRLVPEVLLVLVRVRVLVARSGPRSAARWARGQWRSVGGDPSTDGTVNAGDAQAIAHVVAALAARGPVRVSCLPRSIALSAVLARRGIPNDLRIGVRGDASELVSHAWVEHRGVPLAERAEHLATFAVMDTESYLDR